MNSDNVQFRPDPESGLLVPHEADVRDAEEKLIQDGPCCPAARVGRFADSGRAYVHCGVERRAFAVRHLPVAALKWCGGDYAGESNPLGPCPVWMAMKEKDPALERTYAAQEQGRRDEMTKRQIEAGIRVDDRAQGPEHATGDRELLEELERSGE